MNQNLFAKDSVALEDLDKFIARFETLDDLLGNDAELAAYKSLLKRYMGYDSGFDPIFDKTIEQMKIVRDQIPGFSEKLWRNQALGEEVITLDADASPYSGIEVNNSSRHRQYEQLKTIAQKNSKAVLALNSKTKMRDYLLEGIEKFKIDLEAFNARYPLELRSENLSRSQRKDVELAKKRKEYSALLAQFIAKNNHFLQVRSFFEHALLNSEEWKDTFNLSFAEDYLKALSSLRTFKSNDLVNVERIISSYLGVEVKIDTEFLNAAAKVADRTSQEEKDFQLALQTKKQLSQMPDPRPAQELVYEVGRLQEEYPEADQRTLLSKLSEQGNEKAREYLEQKRSLFDEKTKLTHSLHKNTTFQLPVLVDEEKLEHTVVNQGRSTNTLKPMHAFHASFTGHKTKECVGGASCENLTPRRWALSALDGARTYASHKDGEFSGAIRIVPTEISGEKYDVLDIMFKNVADSQVVQSKKTGQKAKYSLFDLVIDQLKPSAGSNGFVAGDGNSISGNTGLASVYRASAAYAAGKKLEGAKHANLIDAPLEKSINLIFPRSNFSYNPGGMIYEAMPNDASKIFTLVPRDQRPKKTKEEIENLIYNSLVLEGDDLHDHVAWKMAIESEIKLESLDHYMDFSDPKIKAYVRSKVKTANIEEALALYMDVTGILSEEPSVALELEERLSSIISSEAAAGNLDSLNSLIQSSKIPQRLKSLAEKNLTAAINKVSPESKDAITLLRLAIHNKSLFANKELVDAKNKKLREMARHAMKEGDFKFVGELSRLLSVETLIQEGLLKFLNDEKNVFTYEKLHYGIVFSSRELKKNKEIAAAMDRIVLRMIKDAELRGDVHVLAQLAMNTRSRAYFESLKDSPKEMDGAFERMLDNPETQQETLKELKRLGFVYLAKRPKLFVKVNTLAGTQIGKAIQTLVRVGQACKKFLLSPR